MNTFKLNLATLIILTLTSQSVFALNKNSVAAVNGKNITKKQYQDYLKQRAAQNPRGQQAPVNRQAVLDELINREVLLQRAKKLKLHKDKKVIQQLEQVKTNILIQTLISKSPAAKPVTDKELRAVYNKEIVSANLKEYKARHILLKDEAAAKKVIEKLNDGDDFSEMAKNESTGPSSKDGGDLGWFAPERMAPPFSNAVIKMKNGTHSQKPVQTQFGWHVIKLEDSRKRAVPKFEDVKGQIQPVIQNKRLQEYVLKLRSKAKIEVK